MHNLLAQGTGGDGHLLYHPGQLVDMGRTRPCNIHHYRGIKGATIP